MLQFPSSSLKEGNLSCRAKASCVVTASGSMGLLVYDAFGLEEL